jgi:nitroimidazol reductase NimA-like FMN-containing flavoprotein (pyridoxamine 5'-phosphate oxidase superfamily)
MPGSTSDMVSFMNKQRIAAFCTVDDGNKPHVVPVFFTFANEKVYIHTDRASQKIRNLLKNPHVAITIFSGEFGEEAVIIRGRARIVDEDEFVARTREHIEKYKIQLDEEGRDSMGIRCFDSTTRCVIEIGADRLIFW